MDHHIKLYTRQTISHLYHSQVGEHKFGDTMQFFTNGAPWEEQLAAMPCRYVIFGVPEDVGVRANRGRPGADTAWPAALKTLLNMQHNRFNDGSQLALLGHLGFADEIARAHITPQTNPEDLHEIICLIDRVLAMVVQQIVALGKIPIAIGGGHNNAFGLLKGCATALGKPVNALNIDAHTDLRPTNYRHSGNGFLYAFNEGYLGNYVVFGLHENYSLETNLKFIDAHSDRIRFTSYEEMCLRKTKTLAEEAQKALAFVGDGPFGLEVDCDTIENIPSSALTPSGFTTGQARQLVHTFSRNPNATYLHICEAAPDPANANQMMVVGKLISTLVADFIRN